MKVSWEGGVEPSPAPWGAAMVERCYARMRINLLFSNQSTTVHSQQEGQAWTLEESHTGREGGSANPTLLGIQAISRKVGTPSQPVTPFSMGLKDFGMSLNIQTASKLLTHTFADFIVLSADGHHEVFCLGGIPGHRGEVVMVVMVVIKT